MEFSTFKASKSEEIKQLFTKVFSDSEGEAEGKLIGNLTYDIMTGTDAKDLYGFVATENEQIVGSIFFTRLTFENGVSIVLTYGDLNFYSKVGFKLITEKIVKAPLKLTYPEGWLAQSLLGDEIEPIAGNSYCVEAFNKPEIW